MEDPKNPRPNSRTVIAVTTPMLPERTTVERNPGKLNFTSLYENLCFKKPTSPRIVPPKNPAKRIISMLYDNAK